MRCRPIPALVTTTLAVLFAALPHAGRAQMVVLGGAPSEARALTAWYGAHVPPRYRVRSRLTVRSFNDRQMAAYLKDDSGGDSDRLPSGGDGGDGDIDGVFEEDPPQITLRTPASGTPDVFTFAHEYGHYVWFEILRPDDRRRYEALYRKQRAARHLVTAYAATDVEEGFAEAFSFYANEAPILAHRDPLSYQFLSQR